MCQHLSDVPLQCIAERDEISTLNGLMFFMFQGRAKIKELEEQLQVTLTKTHRKVNSLKSQFSEHKNKWEAVSISEILKCQGHFVFHPRMSRSLECFIRSCDLKQKYILKFAF